MPRKEESGGDSRRKGLREVARDREAAEAKEEAYGNRLLVVALGLAVLGLFILPLEQVSGLFRINSQEISLDDLQVTGVSGLWCFLVGMLLKKSFESRQNFREMQRERIRSKHIVTISPSTESAERELDLVENGPGTHLSVAERASQALPLVRADEASQDPETSSLESLVKGQLKRTIGHLKRGGQGDASPAAHPSSTHQTS